MGTLLRLFAIRNGEFAQLWDCIRVLLTTENHIARLLSDGLGTDVPLSAGTN